VAVMETLHNTVPEESRIYVVFVLVILWDVRLNVGAKLIDGDASVMTVCIVYGVLWQVSKMVSAFVEVGIEHNKNRVEIRTCGHFFRPRDRFKFCVNAKN